MCKEIVRTFYSGRNLPMHSGFPNIPINIEVEPIGMSRVYCTCMWLMVRILCQIWHHVESLEKTGNLFAPRAHTPANPKSKPNNTARKLSEQEFFLLITTNHNLTNPNLPRYNPIFFDEELFLDFVPLCCWNHIDSQSAHLLINEFLLSHLSHMVVIFLLQRISGHVHFWLVL